MISLIIVLVAIVSFFLGMRFVSDVGYESAYIEINELLKGKSPIKFRYTSKGYKKIRINILDILAENRKLKKEEKGA